MRRLALALLLLALAAPAWATVTFTAQETPGLADTTGATSYTTASWTPPNGSLVLLAVYNSKATAPDAVNSVTGNGQTWTQVGSSISFHTVASPNGRLTLFRSLISSASAGTLVIDFAGATQTGCAVTVVSVSGIDPGGTNGANAVTNIVTRTANGDVGTATITLAAFGNANNGTYAVFALGGTNTALTVKSGWTGGTGRNYNSPSSSLQAEWIVTNDTTPSETWTGTANTGGIALEVVAASASTPVRHKVNNQ